MLSLNIMKSEKGVFIQYFLNNTGKGILCDGAL